MRHKVNNMPYSKHVFGDQSLHTNNPGSFKKITTFVTERLPWRHKLHISASRVDALVSEYKASDWHAFAIKSRQWRWHVCIACSWIADYAPQSASVFEPGCGSGANLLWLAAQGFTKLSGADIDGDALRLSAALQSEMHYPLMVWEDDCMQPSRLPQEQDVILSANWLYHVPGASLDGFLTTYMPCLSARGGIVLDVVDSSYNLVDGNAYHTKDKDKPESERRPSEYTFRMSVDDVAEVAAKHGLRIWRQTLAGGKPLRRVFMLGRA